MPSPGTNPEQIPGKYHFSCEDYSEKLRIVKIGGAVPNRGGANEQLVGALHYFQEVNRIIDNAPIHAENGMFLNMEPIFNHPADEETIKRDVGLPEMQVGDGAKVPLFIPTHTICRSGTVPHGSTINLIGGAIPNPNPDPNPAPSDDPFKQFVIPGKPVWPTGDSTWPAKGSTERYHLTISDSMGGGGGPFNLDKPAPTHITDPDVLVKDPSSDIAYTQRIIKHALYPYSVRPDLRLRDAVANQNILSHVTISLDSKSVVDVSQGVGGPQGGVINIPFVSRYCPVTRMRFNMWIETVLEDGDVFQQMQYEQVSTFEFGYGCDGATTVWPHTQVNTLRKVKK
jgi:hypothetical protein